MPICLRGAVFFETQCISPQRSFSSGTGGGRKYGGIDKSGASGKWPYQRKGGFDGTLHSAYLFTHSFVKADRIVLIYTLVMCCTLN